MRRRKGEVTVSGNTTQSRRAGKLSPGRGLPGLWEGGVCVRLSHPSLPVPWPATSSDQADLKVWGCQVHFPQKCGPRGTSLALVQMLGPWAWRWVEAADWVVRHQRQGCSGSQCAVLTEPEKREAEVGGS